MYLSQPCALVTTQYFPSISNRWCKKMGWSSGERSSDDLFLLALVSREPIKIDAEKSVRNCAPVVITSYARSLFL